MFDPFLSPGSRRFAVLVLLGTLAGCQAPQAAQQPAAPIEPYRAAWMTYEGRMHVATADLNHALSSFKKALQHKPNYVPAHLGIGDVHRKRGDLERAAESYKQARRIDSKNFDATYKLGLTYQLMRRFDPAVQMYLTALSLDPDSYEANSQLASAYLQSGRPEAALNYARQATELKPESQEAYVNLGAAYASLGRWEKAVDAYRSAAERGELETPIALNLVDALMETGRMQRAINTLRTMTRRTEDGRFHERLGYIYFQREQFDKSLEAYQKAVDLAPRNTAALNGLGVNLMTQYLRGNREKTSLRERAIEAWRKSLRINGDQQRIVDLLHRYKEA